MNLEDNKPEAATDLGLYHNLSDRFNQREALSIDPSAGANAGSSVYMTLVATNPLKELVWSPHKGLILKCADCGFSDRKSALLRGAGLVSSSEPNFMESEAISDLKIDMTHVKEPSDQDNTGDGQDMLEKKTVASDGVSLSDKSFPEENLGDGRRGSSTGLLDVEMEEASKSRENPSSALPGFEGGAIVNIPASQSNGSDPSGDQNLGNSAGMVSAFHPVAEHQFADEHIPSDELRTSPRKDKGKRKLYMSPDDVTRLEKLESTDENDLHAFNISTANEANKVALESETAAVFKTIPLLKYELNPGDDTIVKSHSVSSNSGFHGHADEGKGKALSESNVSGRFPKDEEDEDSYESVESCNTSGIFSAGKRRWSFEHQLIVGTKRAKHLEKVPGNSSTPIKHDSSFMNWISNMMKGFAKPLNQEQEASQPGLARLNSSHVHEHLDTAVDQEVRPINSRSVGFKSIFQSMYCPNKCAEVTTFYHVGEGSAAIAESKESPPDANMMTCHDKENANKVSRESFNEPTQGNELVPLGPSPVSFGNLFITRESERACSSGNHNSNDLEKSKDATKTSGSFPDGRNAKKETSNSPSLEEKRATDLGYKGDPLGSLWITRFCAKSCSMIKQEVAYASSGGVCESDKNLHEFCDDRYAPKARESTEQEPSHMIGDGELKDFGLSTEPSVGFRRTEDSTSMHRMSHILPSARVKTLEAMASVFARRLDALKNIIPFAEAIDEAGRTATCFFCGMKGHSLQTCSEITETELEHLLKNIKSLDKAEGSACLCIRCFQLNHWAIACPNSSQKRHQDNLRNSLKMKEVLTGDVKTPSSYQGEKSNEKPSGPADKIEKWLACEVPKGIFSAIKTIRLSRTDILKWMKSQISLVHLDGYFLRLRLGKWEEGLGRTGYYVACISGMQRKSPLDSKSPISVNVGGIKCSVESQFISNHDFLEDELMAWWCTAAQGGGEIPSEEDLRMKAEEKKMLGF